MKGFNKESEVCPKYSKNKFKGYGSFFTTGKYWVPLFQGRPVQFTKNFICSRNGFLSVGSESPQLGTNQMAINQSQFN